MTGSEHFGKDAGDYHGGDGHSGEATHDHGREHLAHQEFLLLRGLRQSGAGGLGDDGIGREAVECGQGRGGGHQEGDLQDLGRDEAQNDHADNAHHDQEDHGADDVSEHLGGAAIQTVEHIHHQSEHDDAIGVGLIDGVFIQEADAGEDEMFETYNTKTGEREFFVPVRDSNKHVIGYFERHEMPWDESNPKVPVTEYWKHRR